MEINLQLTPPGPVKAQAFIQTDDGTAELRFDFYSPSKQKAITITPNAFTNAGQPDADLDSSIGYVDWGDKPAIPGTFLNLGDAIRKAQQKGMRAPTIKSARLPRKFSGDMLRVASLCTIIDNRSFFNGWRARSCHSFEK